MRVSESENASRANGTLSHGPTTEAGKRRSSMNATRHGLLSKCVLLKYESEELFTALADSYIVRFQPTDEVELACVEEMTAATWRLRRVMAIETTLMNKAIEKVTEETGILAIATAFEQLSPGTDLRLLDRYEARLHRLFRRSLNNLELLRQSGKYAEPEEPILDPAPSQPAPVPADSVLPNEPESAEPPVQSDDYPPTGGSTPPAEPSDLRTGSHPPHQPPPHAAPDRCPDEQKDPRI